MNIHIFLKLVEIQTKVASVIPFLFSTLFTLYAFDTFKVKNALLMFSSMLIFDMTTTAINNYIDYSKAIKKEGYGYEHHNAIVKYHLDPKSVRLLIYGMLIISTLLGILLFLHTNIVVLLLGVLCFIIGVLYSFGPIPISRTPFGEIFSGLSMGFLLPFIAIYIHIFDQNIIHFTFNVSHITLALNYKVLIGLFIVTIPLTVCIANIMLSNNICDINEDIENKRYTLPIFIGKKNALLLWASLYYTGFLAIIIGIVLDLLPLTSLLSLIAIIPVTKNIKTFRKNQLKKETFVLAIKNFLLISLGYIASLLIGILFNI